MSHEKIKALFSEGVSHVSSNISQYTVNPDKELTRATADGSAFTFFLLRIHSPCCFLFKKGNTYFFDHYLNDIDSHRVNVHVCKI